MEGILPGTLTKSVGQKTRGRRRPRKRSIHRFEGEQNIQSDAESETQKWNTGDPRLVPKKSNKFKCSLKSGQSPSLCESKDMAFEVKALKIQGVIVSRKVVNPQSQEGMSSIKIKSKPFSKEPSLERNSQQGIIGVQSLSEGQCAMETGHEYSERIHADDYNGVGSFLESGSNVLEGFNERQQQSEPSETEELTPVSASTVSEKSRVMISEPVTSDIAILEEKDVYISPPDVREVFRSRPRHRRSKLFNAANLPYVMQSEQFLKVNGHRIFDAGDENEEKDENLSRGEERKESYSCNMIAEPTSPNQRMFFDGVGESQETNNCEPFVFQLWPSLGAGKLKYI
ncbi:uncharacterized protein LOC127584426 [Pristis pectinata]|uniref:uncharacterized protein LOC127584426 n=1 Tax=Pristis pectinata TaxID=685728 RepID=UPI00223E391C|nr:uncharacterized protein LOC127584426 [Pristis pectinata]